MHTNIRRRRLLLLAAALILPLSGAGQTSDYPNLKPIKLIVPFPAGGSSDVVGRLIGAQIAASLKQPVVVDNRGGAGGTIGSDVVAKSPPDGYTLLLVDALHIVSPLFNRNTLYDPIKDFSPVGMIAKTPTFLACNSGFEATSVAALVALARKQPGRITVGLPGSGSLVIEMLKLRSGAQFTLVPYKGGAPALNDLVSGNINLLGASIATLSGFVKSGKLRLLATSGTTRHPDYPDVPTFAEAGLPGIEYEQWFGVLAPANLPRVIASTLSTALAQAIKAPEVRERFDRLALEPYSQGPDEFRARIVSDSEKWHKIAAEAGIKPSD